MNLLAGLVLLGFAAGFARHPGGPERRTDPGGRGREGESEREPAGGFPPRFVALFSVLWFLLGLPAAWDAWQGHAPLWMMAVPLVGPVLVSVVSRMARDQARRLHARPGQAPETVEEALARLVRGEDTGLGENETLRRIETDPEKVRRAVSVVTALVAAAPLVVAYVLWSRGELGSGPLPKIFLGLVLVGSLFAFLVRRYVLRLYDEPRYRVPATAPPLPTVPVPVRQGGIWLVVPILLVVAATWVWKQMELERIREREASRRQIAEEAEARRPVAPLPEPGSSPCPNLLAEIARVGEAVSEDALEALFQCKMRRPHYQRLRSDSRLEQRAFAERLQPLWYPEERAVRQVVLALAARRTPPDGVEVHAVPELAEPPRIDGVPDEPAWSRALSLGLPGASPAARSRLRLGWHDGALYAAVIVAAEDLPPGVDIAKRASLALLLQPGLSRWLDYQYFFVYADGPHGYASHGCRIAERVRFPERPPPGGWPEEERWKGIRFNECGLFAVEGGAGLTEAGRARTFEARVTLEDAGIDARHPFTLGARAEVAQHYIGDDFRSYHPVWLVLE
ncbi:MAG: hypothetical protein KatS3mg076_1354 [Candidatus Binatia bacterium]|nr:MAG: hypothetical protein KatS3mg076_1354 [Candidatus Binatia bacterium]